MPLETFHNHVGIPPQFSPAKNLRPRSLQDDGRPLVLSGLRVHDCTDADACQIKPEFTGWLASGVYIDDVEIRGVIKTPKGAQAGLHVDALQMHHTGRAIPWVMRNVKLEALEGAETFNAAGEFSRIYAEACEANKPWKFKVKTPELVLRDWRGQKVYCWEGVGRVLLIDCPDTQVQLPTGGTAFPRVVRLHADEVARMATELGQAQERERRMQTGVQKAIEDLRGLM